MAETPSRPRQQCPNCGVWQDVSVYVSGQRVRCRCGLHFEVQRQVAKSPTSPTAERPVAPEPPRRIPLAPHPGALAAARPIAAPTAAREDAPAPGQARADLPLTVCSPSSERAAPVAEVATEPAPVLAPTVISPAVQIPGYAPIERLGQGGMGEVWKARRLDDGRVFAVKILAAELAKDQSLLVRFEKEVAALAALDHPGIVKLVSHDFHTPGLPPFFAMELCAGKTLRERMADPHFTVSERLAVFSDLCRVLAHAHERGVIHRDLKPDNVLFDEAGHLKLIDFGLAGLVGGDPRFQLTEAAMTMGTVDYMPPEQRTDARSVDARGDVWSLGVMLYELLSGALPVGHFKPLCERMPGLDPRLDELVRAALVPDRAARLQSAEAMADAVDAIRGVSVNRPGPLKRSERREASPSTLKKRSDVWSLAVAAAIVLVALLGAIVAALLR